MNQENAQDKRSTNHVLEIVIRVGLIAFLLLWCLQIISPFISLIVWAGIIAISIYTPFTALANKLGGNNKLAAIVLSAMVIVTLLVPIIFLSGSLVESVSSLATQVSEDTLTVSPPSENVSSWPIMGEKIYTVWEAASVNASKVLQEYSEQVKAIGRVLVSMAAGVGIGILQFVISMAIAGVFLTNSTSINQGIHRLAQRLMGGDEEALLQLSTATIRSVAVGVLGIATLQGILSGLGMMIVGVPGAGLIAFFVVVLAIAQLPALLVLGPVIFYVFSIASPTVATIFMIWTVIVGFIDVVLKPIFLGRGVDAPMMVILLGAIGGMMFSGIVGLFTGAVTLALGYKLFQIWLNKPTPALTSDKA